MSAESGCGIVSDLNYELYIYFSDNSKGLTKGSRKTPSPEGLGAKIANYRFSLAFSSVIERSSHAIKTPTVISIEGQRILTAVKAIRPNRNQLK